MVLCYMSKDMENYVVLFFALRPEAIKGSNRVIGMDSGFGVLSVLPELRKRGLRGTVVLKKKKFWAKGLPGDEILEALRMEHVGTTKV